MGAPVALPGGGVLTPRRFLQLGLRLGTLAGFETLHFMLEGSFLAPYCVYVPAALATHSAATASSAPEATAESTKDSSVAASSDCSAQKDAVEPAVNNGVEEEEAAQAVENAGDDPVRPLASSKDESTASIEAEVLDPPQREPPPKRFAPGFLHAIVNWQPFELQPLTHCCRRLST